MNWVLIIFMSSSIHSLNFEDYNSCMKAGYQIKSAYSASKFTCSEK